MATQTMDAPSPNHLNGWPPNSEANRQYQTEINLMVVSKSEFIYCKSVLGHKHQRTNITCCEWEELQVLKPPLARSPDLEHRKHITVLFPEDRVEASKGTSQNCQ